MLKHLTVFFAAIAISLFCHSCGTLGASSSQGQANMGGPTAEERAIAIASEKTGNFYYGRRYHIEHTRFWGYLRKPRQSAYHSELVVMNERKKTTPDRLPEEGLADQRYGFDNNYEYRIYGYYTGEKAYEINSNQILPEFLLTGYELVSRNPGWLFKPDDHFNPKVLTLKPRL
ncbi:MAG: hypothetical protein ACSHX0_05520 [Akkermansiaceae bacterium]